MRGQKHNNEQYLSKSKRSLQAFFCFLFIAICCTPLIGLMINLDTTNLEKRTLAPKPVLMVDGQINQQYTHDLEAYFSDHFPPRPYLISAWHMLKQNIFGLSGSDRVISGSDGWLFFADTLDDYLGINEWTATDRDRLKNTLTIQKSFLNERGVFFLVTVAPNKNSLYGQYMPSRFEPLLQTELPNQWLTQQTEGYVDLFEPLQQASMASDQQLYHKRDSHWNNLGARLAVETLVKNLDANLLSVDSNQLPGPEFVLKRDWIGDLSVMLYPSGPEPDLQYYLTHSDKYRYTRPIRSFEDMLIQTQNPAGHNSLLMFRDSFANAMIPLLSTVFAEATYSRALPYDYALIENKAVDVVIVEIAQRNMKQLLLHPPRMPALSVEHLPAAGENAQRLPTATISTQVELDRDWIKISAWFHADALRDSKRVLFSLIPEQTSKQSAKNGTDPAFYEAFPIVTTENLQDDQKTNSSNPRQRDAGLTAYLPDKSVLDREMQMVLYVETDQGWFQVQTDLSIQVSDTEP